MAGLWVGVKQLGELRQGEEVEQDTELIESPKGTSGVDVTTGDGWVEGLSTGENDRVAVIGETDRAYPVYSEPDSQSRVVYYAKEGEDLRVLEERAQWYRVVLPDSTSGWLSKTSVKSTESSPD